MIKLKNQNVNVNVNVNQSWHGLIGSLVHHQDHRQDWFNNNNNSIIQMEENLSFGNNVNVIISM